MRVSHRIKAYLAATTAVIVLGSHTLVYAAQTPDYQDSNDGVPAWDIAAPAGTTEPSATALVPRQLLIYPKPGTDLKDIQELNREARATSVGMIDGLGVVKVRVSGDLDAALSLYRSSGLVEYAEPNYRRKAAAIPNDPLYAEQWGLRQVGMEDAWEKAGTGLATVNVAVLDTGVDVTHEDLRDVLARDPANPDKVLGKHFHTDRSGRPLSDDNVQDNVGHGTHITGIIGATANNGIGVAGVAPAARIMPIKVLDDVGYGDDANIARGLMWAVDNGARVVNMSLFGPAQSKTLAAAIEYARARGTVLIAATGNDGLSGPTYPAAYEGVIGVGAVDDQDSWMHQSNFGSHLDVVAPGVSIASTYLPAKSVGGEPYAQQTGTSMAAGFVSGLAALCFSVNPSITDSKVEGIIYASADDLGTIGWDRYYGYGRVNGSRAVAITKSDDGSAPVVTVTSPASGTTATGKILTATASVSDPGGDVAFVDAFVNGARVGSDNSAPYQFNLDVAQLIGRNTVRMVAYDKSGNSGFADVTVYKQTFSDVASGYWAFEAIESLTARKVVAGYPDGSFRPNSSVGRAEFVKMTMEGMGLTKKSHYSGYFKDVPITYWAWPYIEAAYEMGLINGYSGGLFGPERRIKRVEMATVLIKTGAFAINYSGNPFGDVPPGHWGYAYVMSARNAGVISGYPDNSFRPDQSMTRAESAKAITNAFFSN